MSPDRRLHQRKQPERLVFCKLGGENGGSVLNLSEDGLCFESLTRAPEKGLLELRLSVELTDAVDAVGKVAWVDPEHRTGGLRFIGLSDAAREQIRAWLGKPAAAEAPQDPQVPPPSWTFPPHAEPAPPIQPTREPGADAGPSVESWGTFPRRRDEQVDAASATPEKPVIWQEMQPPATRLQLIPIERYMSETRWQFTRGVLVGIVISALVTIPVFKFAGGGKLSGAVQTASNATAAAQSTPGQREAARVSQPTATSSPRASSAQPARVQAAQMPSFGASSPAATPQSARAVTTAGFPALEGAPFARSAKAKPATPSGGVASSPSANSGSASFSGSLPRQAGMSGSAALSDVTRPSASAATAQPARAQQFGASPAQSPPGSPASTAGAYSSSDARSSSDQAQRSRKVSPTPQQLWSAVQAGNMKAAVALADLYARGDGVPLNCDQARVLLLVASEKRNPEAPKKLQELDHTGCPAAPR